MEKKRILVFNPSMPGNILLPYTYGLARLACEDKVWSSDLHWEEPFFFPYQGEALKLDLSKIDILLLCVYTWNKPLCLAIADNLKKINPSGFIIAGGPEPSWSDPHIFERGFSSIDVISKDEIEALPVLLETFLKGESLQDVPNLILNEDGNRFVTETKEKKPLKKRKGPFAELFSEYKSLVEKTYPGEKDFIMAPLETNRGCPYKCSFCDWGSATFSKVREIPLREVKEELDAIAKLKVSRIFITDANFGILKRDVEIARYISSLKEKTGYPKTVFWSNAKNHHKNVSQIVKWFAKADLMHTSLINYQSTDPKVLEIMDRSNLSLQNLQDLLTESKGVGLPTTAVTIVGSPGEDRESSLKTLNDIISGGHESFRFNPYLLLPNAPASDESYTKAHQIRSIERPLPVTRLQKEDLKSPYYPRVHYLISHNQMDSNDWVEMMVNNSIVSALYFMGPIKLTWDYLTFHSAKVDVHKLIESVRKTSLKESISQVENHLKSFVANDHSHMMDVPDSRYMVEIDQFLAYSLLKTKEGYKGFLNEFLLEFKEDIHRDSYEMLSILQEELLLHPNTPKQRYFEVRLAEMEEDFKDFLRNNYPAPENAHSIKFVTSDDNLGLSGEVFIFKLLTNMASKGNKPIHDIIYF